MATGEKKKHILIVDDEEIWLSVISQYLQAQGYGVVTASSGADALSALKSFTPDLIMSDVRMPDMNGFEFVDTLKRRPSTKTTPVIFLSAIDDFDARRVARDIGAADYLVKPLDAADVGAILKKFLAR